MDVVSFETAKRLKDAGFQNPPDAGYFNNWYYASSGNSLWESRYATVDEKTFIYCIYAPTATDILREIPEALLTYLPESSDWMCFEYDEWDNLMPWKFAHENPAEACALAWLELNKKQE